MNGMDYSGSVANQIIDEAEPLLPYYVPYLSLVFKLLATAVNLMFSGWVVYTISTTRSLHKPHNIFVANLLISGMIAVLTGCLIASTMMISYQVGVEPFFDCSAIKLYFIPFHVSNMSIVIIAADKVVAISSPFKYRRMMKPRVMAAIIGGTWLLAFIPTILSMILDVDGYFQVAKYGICIAEGAALVEATMIYVIPLIIAPVFTITLNVYLSIKVFKIYQKIESETRPAGTTTNNQPKRVTTLERKQRSIMRHKKPIVTLLIVVIGSVAINLLFPVFFFLGRVLIDSEVYHHVIKLVISRNIIYVVRFFHPLVYGLYFKQVRVPMMRSLKRCLRINKINSVSPQQ